MNKYKKITKMWAILLSFGMLQVAGGVVFADFRTELSETNFSKGEGTAYLQFSVSEDKKNNPDWATERYLIQDILADKTSEILNMKEEDKAAVGKVTTTVTKKEEAAGVETTQLSRVEKTDPQHVNCSKLAGKTLVDKQYSMCNILKEYLENMNENQFNEHIKRSRVKWDLVKKENNNDQFKVNWESANLDRLKELVRSGEWKVDYKETEAGQNNGQQPN